MDDDLERHLRSPAARRRAEAAGLDLDALKHDDPDAYRMLCAVPVLYLARELRGLAEGPLQAALAGQHLFKAEAEERLLFLAFPGPAKAQLDRLDDLLAAAVDQEASRRQAYFRVVQDRSGTRRELDLPTVPEAWTGRSTMVGPFTDEAQAAAWAEQNVDPRSGVTYDVLAYAGAWFCDVFRAGEG
jgi:hypothetical protein